MDTRKHTKHVLRPTPELVEAFLGRTDDDTAWRAFAKAYRALLDARYRTERAAFDALAARARNESVYLGCNCPTAKNPDVRRCHTTLALAFMKERYADLDVQLPQ